MTGEHAVYQFFANGKWELVESFADLQAAVRTARALSESVSAKMGLTSRVIIMDAMGFTSFEWIKGRGLVFPTSDMPRV
ncbi:MAG TPA: hypothetical protein VH855_15400 [Acetobacteraceae bacterium]|jgi:hypothetical protein